MPEESQWFEVTEDLWRDEHEVRPRLRLLADENLPAPFVTELQSANIDVRTTAELGLSSSLLCSHTLGGRTGQY